ncbi:unnamed protein product [Sphagnum balticum]
MADNLMAAPPSKDWDSPEQPEYAADYDVDDIPWLIDPKHPSVECLKKWRKCTAVINSTPRFRYIPKSHEERTTVVSPAATLNPAAHLRAVIRAVAKFQSFHQNEQEVPPDGFGVPQTVVHQLQDCENESLQKLGGVESVARTLLTNLEGGFHASLCDPKQLLQFQRLNEEKEDIQLAVVRGGCQKVVSIFDLVPGDILPSSLGGQVPADGIMVEGRSLSIKESEKTGEHDPVRLSNL